MATAKIVYELQGGSENCTFSPHP